MTLPRPAPGTLKWWIIGAVGISAGIALVVWFALSATLGLPSWQTYSFKVVDDRSVTVTFDVHRPGGQPLTCTIEALDRDFGRVGSVSFAVPKTETDSSRHTATVRTTTRAVTGQVRTCTMP
jgi:hypothetical protein